MAPAPPLPDQTLAIPDLACLPEPRLTGAASPPPAVAASFPYLRRLSAPAQRNPAGLWPDVEELQLHATPTSPSRPPALQTASCSPASRTSRSSALLLSCCVSSLDGNCQDGGVTDTGLAILAQATSDWSDWSFWIAWEVLMASGPSAGARCAMDCLRHQQTKGKVLKLNYYATSKVHGAQKLLFRPESSHIS